MLAHFGRNVLPITSHRLSFLSFLLVEEPADFITKTLLKQHPKNYKAINSFVDLLLHIVTIINTSGSLIMIALITIKNARE